MKYLISIIFITGLLFPGIVYSDNNKIINQQDSSISKEFVDENKNGINDRDENQERKCYRGRRGDRFIDKDGDGISDEREDVIGPKRRHRGGKNGKNK